MLSRLKGRCQYDQSVISATGLRRENRPVAEYKNTPTHVHSQRDGGEVRRVRLLLHASATNQNSSKGPSRADIMHYTFSTSPIPQHEMGRFKGWDGMGWGWGVGGGDFSIHFNIVISLAHMLIRFLDPLSVYRAEQGGTRVHLLVLQLLLLLKP